MKKQRIEDGEVSDLEAGIDPFHNSLEASSKDPTTNKADRFASEDVSNEEIEAKYKKTYPKLLFKFP